MTKMTFSVAKDFSAFPGPRRSVQGLFSGEALRKLLARRLRAHPGGMTINLDGTRGYGSSFLDEAFGGLIRSENFPKAEILNRLQFISKLDPTYVDEIMESINKARPEVSAE
jgi:hypothetical protein